MNQLTLFRPNPRHTFASFHPPQNHAVNAVLQPSGENPGPIWLHGPANSGKSHLLQAICHRAQDNDQTAVYLPLTQVRELGPATLRGLEQCAWICLDDVQEVLGQDEWEQELFALFNQAIDHGIHLLLAARMPAQDSGSRLPDLKSRLQGTIALSLELLDDEQQIAALQLRARTQGYELSGKAVRYLQRYRTRDFGQLCAVLDAMEAHALSEKRKITLPYVRQFSAQM